MIYDLHSQWSARKKSGKAQVDRMPDDCPPAPKWLCSEDGRLTSKCEAAKRWPWPCISSAQLSSAL